MRNRQISNEIQVRVMKFLDYVQSQEQNNPLKGQDCLE